MSQIPPTQPFGARMFGHRFQEPKQPVDPQDVADQMDDQVAMTELIGVGVSPEDQQRLMQLGIAYDINAGTGGAEFWFVSRETFDAVRQWHDQGQPDDLIVFLGY